MANISWVSGAPAIAQVVTLTVGGTAANGQVYTVAMGINNTKTVSYTATGTDTNTTIATAIYNALTASTYPEFEEETWANPSAGTITATANTAGLPFTLACSATGTGTLTQSTTTASSGPNDVEIASNWSLNRLPANGDDMFVTGTSQGLLYNLQALAAVTLASLTWDTTFTGSAGLPAQNASGYAEYRQTYFQVSATTENYLPGTGGGSPFIQRDQGSAAWTVNVQATGSPAVQGRPALLLKGTNAANVLNVTLGNVGSAIDPGDLATWQTINVGYQQSKKTDVTLSLGAGCTLTTINQNGGKITARTAVSAWTQNDGTAAFYGAGALTTLDVEGGTFSYQSNGALGTWTVGAAGTLDFSADPRARNAGAGTVYGTLLDPNKTVTFGSPISFPEGVSGQNGATIDLGREMHLQRS